MAINELMKITQATIQDPELGVGTTIPPADALAVARFEQLMGASSSQAVTESNGVAAALNTIQPEKKIARTMGDSIYDGLRRLSGNFENSYQDLKTVFGAKEHDMSVFELLGMQATFMRFSVQLDLAGKFVTQWTKNIDQLTHIQ